MDFARALLAALVFVFAAGNVSAQQKRKPGSDDQGYVPTVAPDSKSKKKKDDQTQTLPPPPELPVTVSAETNRLAFQVSPLSSRGLLSQQTRDALKTLLKNNHGTIVKLRAFVAGSGDLRRVGELVGETFTEKRQPLPVLSVVQVGALPQEGAQVVIESTETDRRVVNPNGIAFLSGQPAATVAESLGKLTSALAAAGMQPSDALSVTCFVSSLDAQRDIQPAMAATFPGAALNYVQMRREPVTPVATCEARARLPQPASSVDSHVALISDPQIVITGTQLAFGAQDGDLTLAFDRLEKALAAKNTRLDRVVVSHLYVTSNGLAPRVLAAHAARFGHHPSGNTLLPVEALPSLDAPFGIDVIAVPDSSARR